MIENDDTFLIACFNDLISQSEFDYLNVLLCVLSSRKSSKTILCLVEKCEVFLCTNLGQDCNESILACISSLLKFKVRNYQGYLISPHHST